MPPLALPHLAPCPVPRFRALPSHRRDDRHLRPAPVIRAPFPPRQPLDRPRSAATDAFSPRACPSPRHARTGQVRASTAPVQFAHFTCVQAVLDELGGAACIHVLDLDIGVGEQCDGFERIGYAYESLLPQTSNRQFGTKLWDRTETEDSEEKQGDRKSLVVEAAPKH